MFFKLYDSRKRYEAVSRVIENPLGRNIPNYMDDHKEDMQKMVGKVNEFLRTLEDGETK